jgi:hypothetical protein
MHIVRSALVGSSLLGALLSLAACGSPEPPPAGFGAECQFNADCGDGYVCLDATCVPDDIEAPDPVGDGDGDGDDGSIDVSDWLAPVTMEVPDCDALRATYPDANVCTIEARVGTPSYDAFQELIPVYPEDLEDCGIIEGSLMIFEGMDPQLSYLSGVRGICGDLRFDWAEDVEGLSGLSNLTHVLGRLEISAMWDLTSLQGLESLEEVGELHVANVGVSSLAPLRHLKRTQQLWLAFIDITSLEGLHALEEVGMVHIFNVDGLTTLGGAEALTRVRTVSVDSLPALTSLAGVWRGAPEFVWLDDLPLVTSVPPWPASQTAPVRLSIVDVPQLSAWPSSRLDDRVEHLELRRTGFGGLEMVGEGPWSVEHLELAENPALSDVEALSALTAASSVSIYGNPLLDNCDIEAVFSPMELEELVVHTNGAAGACAP